MELFVIKFEDGSYLRQKKGRLLAVGLAKASVYPPEKLSQLKALCLTTKNHGLGVGSVYRLTVTEEPVD